MSGHIRASALLRCALHLGAALVVGVTLLLLGMKLTVAAAIGLVSLFVLHPAVLIIEWLIVWRATRRSDPIPSLWFVDYSDVGRRSLAKFHRDTEDNPTIR